MSDVFTPSGKVEGHRAPRPDASLWQRLADWLDRRAEMAFLLPAVVLILAFSILPLVMSLIIALSRLRLQAGGFRIRFVGLQNFEKVLFGSEQYHFLGAFGGMSALGYAVTGLSGAALLWWLIRAARGGASVAGLAGRSVTALVLWGCITMFAATLLSGHLMGTLGVTLTYVIIGCSLQFVIATALAAVCARDIRGRGFFRVLFFVPFTITPAGVGYCFRMLAETQTGPFKPVFQYFGLGDFAWTADIWAARLVIIAADSWQWIPFIFIIMLAAFENVSRDQVEAAHVDGASGLQIFREITWPQVAPVAATVMLIRVIEAFKIIDLPNIMTAGGPGIATESATLHAFYKWRALDFSESAAVAYLLLLVAVVSCLSFFNLVVHRTAKGKADG